MKDLYFLCVAPPILTRQQYRKIYELLDRLSEDSRDTSPYIKNTSKHDVKKKDKTNE